MPRSPLNESDCTYRRQANQCSPSEKEQHSHHGTLSQFPHVCYQTRLFPAVLSLGNKYIMILHHVDSNSSWLETMRNQSGGKLILTCARALARMQCRGLIPKHQILDNQASAEYKAAIEASGMTCELVPPEEHQRNMAEKAIQTFKDHFVGVLSGCAPSMPIHLWCQLLPQVE